VRSQQHCVVTGFQVVVVVVVSSCC
jgi:hypothetical protein